MQGPCQEQQSQSSIVCLTLFYNDPWRFKKDYRIELVNDQTLIAGLAAVAASVLTVDLFWRITHVEVSVKQEVPLAHHVGGTSKVTLPVPASITITKKDSKICCYYSGQQYIEAKVLFYVYSWPLCFVICNLLSSISISSISNRISKVLNNLVRRLFWWDWQWFIF